MNKHFPFSKLVHETVNEEVLKYFSDARSAIAHYTSPNGFLSIIQNRELWFGNVGNMNDLTEVKYAFEEIIRPCIKYFPFYNEETRKHILRYLKKCEDYHFSFVYDDKILTEKANIFSFSTSFNRDSAMLWNMYCKNNGNLGYALIFDKNCFSNKLCESNLPVDGNAARHYLMEGKVVYDRENQIEIVKDFLDHLDYAVCQQETDDAAKRIIEIYTQKLLIIALYIKDSDFEKEQEYKFVAICDDRYMDTDKNNPPYLTFASQNGNIIPRLAIPFSYELLKGVVISSFNMDKNAEETTRYFLDKHGLKNISIVHARPKMRL